MRIQGFCYSAGMPAIALPLFLALSFISCASGQPSTFPRVDKDLAALDFKAQQMSANFSQQKGDPADPDWASAKLAVLFEIDVLVRMSFFSPHKKGYSPGEKKYFMGKLDQRLQDMDRRHTAELKSLLKHHDWFTISRFGAEADKQAWLLVQHADLDREFQKEVLRRLERYLPSKDTQPRNYAYLYDRVATNEKRRQRYGTQGQCTGAGQWQVNPLADPVEVDKLRAKVGLKPLAAYIKRNSKSCH
jgi:hypothetical protein